MDRNEGAASENGRQQGRSTDPFAVIEWVIENAQKLKFTKIMNDVQETIENGKDVDVVEETAASLRAHFSKLMMQHTELAARLFFLQSLKDGRTSADDVSLQKQTNEARAELASLLETDEVYLTPM